MLNPLIITQVKPFSLLSVQCMGEKDIRFLKMRFSYSFTLVPNAILYMYLNMYFI